MDRQLIMAQWDSWVKYYKEGGGASWPRDAFESLLDYFEEQMNNWEFWGEVKRHLPEKPNEPEICGHCGGIIGEGESGRCPLCGGL